MDSFTLIICACLFVACGQIARYHCRTSVNGPTTQARFDALCDAMIDAVVWTDGKGRIRDCNSAAQQIFRRAAHELTGQNLSTFMPALSGGTLPDADSACWRRKNIQFPRHSFDARVEATDGTDFPVQVLVRRTAIRWPSEFVVLIRDLSKYDLAQCELHRYAEQLLLTKQALESHNALLETTIRERTEELRCAKVEAELANAAKSNFLANMSHELRTPLHAILSFSRFGQRRMGQVSNEKLWQYFETIERCGNTLLELVNQLLDLAKLESGTVVLERKPSDLADIVRDVAQSLDALADERNITIQTLLPDSPLVLFVDRKRLTQVIRNLLSNALKVSPTDGTVEIQTALGEEAILLRVVDQGPGIPFNELERIFEKFAQSSLNATGAGGTGLGLAICREIATLHGGRIWAENTKPHGAAFCVEFPRQLLVENRHNSHSCANAVDRQESLDTFPVAPFSHTPEANLCP